jgi:hypothetical protein
VAIPRRLEHLEDRIEDLEKVEEASERAGRRARGINVAMVDDDVELRLHAKCMKLHIARSRLR